MEERWMEIMRQAALVPKEDHGAMLALAEQAEATGNPQLAAVLRIAANMELRPIPLPTEEWSSGWGWLKAVGREDDLSAGELPEKYFMLLPGLPEQFDPRQVTYPDREQAWLALGIAFLDAKEAKERARRTDPKPGPGEGPVPPGEMA